MDKLILVTTMTTFTTTSITTTGITTNRTTMETPRMRCNENKTNRAIRIKESERERKRERERERERERSKRESYIRTTDYTRLEAFVYTSIEINW